MGNKPGKRRLRWFRNPRPSAPRPPYTPIDPKAPGAIGKMWRQEPRDRERTDSWLLREPQAPEKPSPPQAGLEPYPALPAWPPPLESARLAARVAGEERRDRSSGESSTDEYAAPIGGQSQPGARPATRQDPPHEGGGGKGGRLRALWAKASRVVKAPNVAKIAASFRRPRVALATIGGILILGLLFGAAAFSAAFFNGLSTGSQGAPGAGNAKGAVMSPTAGQATASVTTTTTPGTTRTPTTLTVAITCQPASVSSGGTAQLCAHTLPGAALSLSVSYSKCRGVKTYSSAGNADSGGNYTWNWKVPTTCRPGATADATVTASSEGQTVTQSAPPIKIT